MYKHERLQQKLLFTLRFGCFLLFFLLTASSHGANVFENGAENTLDTASEDVVVRDGATPTTLNVVEGALISPVPAQDPPLPEEGRAIGLFGSSVLNFSAGEAAGTLQINDTAVANISGGAIGEDLEQNGGTVSFSGGTVADDVFVNAGTFNLSGGEIGDQFFVDGTATLNIADTAGPVNDDLFIRGDAVLTMAGAQLGDELFVQNNAMATITGGYIDDDLNANDAARITVDFVEIDDSVDTSETGFVRFNDGIVNGGFEAAGDSVIEIAGGTFENVATGGEVVLAAGGTINITGGTFGSGGDADGSIGASLGGVLNFSGGQASGLADGVASETTLGAVLGSTVNLSGGEFDVLALEAGNAGLVVAGGFTASAVSVSTQSEGLVQLVDGVAEGLTVTADLEGIVELSGGSFSDISVSLDGASQMTILGSDFAVNGFSLDELDGALNDENAYNEQTGALGLVAGEITGVLKDGSPFTLQFTRSFLPLDAASTIRVIPEPSSSMLLALPLMFSLALIRRRR